MGSIVIAGADLPELAADVELFPELAADDPLIREWASECELNDDALAAMMASTGSVGDG